MTTWLLIAQLIGLGPWMAVWDPYPMPDTATLRLYVDDVLVATLPGDATKAPVTVPAAGSHVLGISAVVEDFESTKDTFAFTALGTPPPPDPTCIGHALTIAIEDWTKAVAIGARGRILFTLVNAFPIVQLQVRSGTQVIGQFDGTDLRDVAAARFGVPRIAGTYPISVFIKDGSGCSAETTLARSFVVS